MRSIWNSIDWFISKGEVLQILGISSSAGKAEEEHTYSWGENLDAATFLVLLQVLCGRKKSAKNPTKCLNNLKAS